MNKINSDIQVRDDEAGMTLASELERCVLDILVVWSN